VKIETWKIDGDIDLTAICSRNNWHRASAIAELSQLIEGRDAEAFVDFMFCEAAEFSGERPEDYLTDAQWKRLL